MASNVTFQIDSRRLFRAAKKAVRPGLRAGGTLVKAGVQAELASMNVTRGGGGAGKAGTLGRSIRVRNTKGGVGVRVGAPPGSEAAAALVRLTAGYAGKDRKGRLYTQPGRAIFTPVLQRSRAAIVRKIGG